MSHTRMRISRHTRSILREMAAQTGETVQALLEKAVEAYQRQRFYDDLDAAYARLRNDPEAWAAEREERAEWDSVLMDGIPHDERWGSVSDATLAAVEQRLRFLLAL